MTAGALPPERGSHGISPHHVVFANWRDSRHPQAGGAELYCESVARRLAQRGVRVTLLTSRPPGAAADEVVERVNVRRRGGTFTVYLHALAWLAFRRSSVGAVIDCQNGIPFFSPLVTRRRTPVVCLVFHVHQEQFGTYFRWPMDRIGRWLEGPVSRLVYGRRSIVVISPSTRAGVRSSLKLRGLVHVVPCGADARSDGVRTRPRSRQPHIVCVGRLVPHKQMNLLIGAIPAIAAAHPDLTVSIAGSGPALDELRGQAARLGLGDRVAFHGQVSNQRREELLEEAWLTVNPSAGEGWGLSVIEANACGVPAVAFRVPGLQDSVVPNRTGWLVDPGTDLAPTIIAALRTLSDPQEAPAWWHRAREWAAGFSWDTTTSRLLDVLAQEEARLSRWGGESAATEKRRPSDVACHVSLPADAATPATLASIRRRTDVWVRNRDRIEVLMPGTDEFGVRCALERLDLTDAAQVRVARPVDWLLSGAPLP
jgi:glycosyltransferase involved in cell wall biosynthesis